MPLPLVQDLLTLSSNAGGLQPESLDERILTCLAMLASGTGPDGTALPGGSSGGLTLISRQVLAAPAATVTFSAIPATFENLVLKVTARLSDAAPSAHLTFQFNGDTGANYNNENLNGNAAVASAAASTGATAGRAMELPANTATANVAGAGQISILDYARTVFFKTFFSEALSYSGNPILDTWSGYWANTAAINQIALLDAGGGNFVTGSVFSLYGES